MKKNYAFLWAMVISIVYVLFLWRKEDLPQAIGINLTVFWLSMLGFYIYTQKEKLDKKSIFWILPIVLIAVSFSLYASVFTSMISLFIFPYIFFLFTTHQSHSDFRESLWSRYFIISLIVSIFYYIGSIFQSTQEVSVKDIKNATKKATNKNTLAQIILGILLLSVLASVIIIPLLSSANAEFASFFENFLKTITDLLKHIKPIIFWKIIVAFFGTFFVFALSVYWNKKISPLNIIKKSSKKSDDSIILGIVLSGILAIYLLFIWFQIKILFVSSLPVKFTDTENLVKSGFWQLIVLTVINIILYAGIYNKNTKTIQRILSAFTVVSLLLVLSAGHKVYMYVYNYGLSFEKFFALYTVLFCAVVFAWFISLFARKNKKANIVKTLAFIALWMYSITTVIPLEKIIFDTNLKLTQRADSRVNINELTMLGFDALESVEKNKDILIREAIKDTKWGEYMKIIEKENSNIEVAKKEYISHKWNYWLSKTVAEQNLYGYWYYDNEDIDLDKNEKTRKWYEKTFKEIFYKPNYKVTDKIKYRFDDDDTKNYFYTTFKSVNHGFEFDNPKKLDMYFNDFKTVEDLKNSDFKLTLYADETHDEKLKITFYNKCDTSPSEDNREILKLIEEFKVENYPKVNLKNFPNNSVYMWIKEDKKKNMYFGLLIEFPNGYMVVKANNNKMPKDTKFVRNMSEDDYVNLMIKNEDFRNIIKSIKLVK